MFMFKITKKKRKKNLNNNNNNIDDVEQSSKWMNEWHYGDNDDKEISLNLLKRLIIYIEKGIDRPN